MPPRSAATRTLNAGAEREFFIDNLLVRVHFIIVMIRWTGLAPWEFKFSFPGSLTSAFLLQALLLSDALGDAAKKRGYPLTLEGKQVIEAHRLLYHSA